MNIEQRFKYYLGNFYNKNFISITVDEKYKIFSQNKIFFYTGPNQVVNNFPFHYGCLNPGWWWGLNNNFCVDFPCLTNSADGFETDELPVITKSRKINDNNGILVKYEYDYTWKPTLLFNDTTNFKDKISNVCWRGNHTTGLEKTPFNRRFLVKKYFEKYDIGFFPERNDDFCNENKNLFKSFMDKSSQTKYKYIISMEGNDTGTSLKWLLSTNSVVLMQKPIIESWLMEGLLIPYYHYVPLKDDLSDLEEIIDWCNTNEKKCMEIIENAKKFMLQFKNENDELILHNKITKWYKDNIIFIHENNKNLNYDNLKDSFNNNSLITSRLGCVESCFILNYKYNVKLDNTHFDYTKDIDFYMKSNAGLYYKNNKDKKKILDWWTKNTLEFVEKSILTSSFNILHKYDIPFWKKLKIEKRLYYNYGELHKFILKNIKGKKMLFVGNAVKSIEYSFNNNIFRSGWTFEIDNFTLKTIETPQTTLGMNYPDNSIIETTEKLFNKICEEEFDTAIFCCGSYGPPLINLLTHHFNNNKNLIYLGSLCFSMFCIYSEGMPIDLNDTEIISEKWIKVLEKCPIQCKNIDAGKYWSQ